MTGDKIGFFNQVIRIDWVWTKTQVRNSLCSRFFGVIHKITLNIIIGSLTNDFDGVFIRSNSTIRPQTVKHTVNGCGFGIKCIVVIQTFESHVIIDANGKVIFRFFINQFVINSFNHRWSKLF